MLLFKYGKFKIKIYHKRTWKDLWDFIAYKFFYDKSAKLGVSDVKIPDHELETLARAILPDIIKFFESKKGKSEFEKWEEEQKRLNEQNKVG